MRIINTYIDRTYIDILTYFGTLDEVVNNILREASNGNIDPYDKPECPRTNNEQRVSIAIDNEMFESELDIRGAKSSHCSIRRLIYWFVDNEMYEQLGWKATCIKGDKLNTVTSHCIDECIYSLSKLNNLVKSDKSHSAIKKCIQQLTSLEEYV